MENVKRIIGVAHHRNCISGDPFYAVLFEDLDGVKLVGCVAEDEYKTFRQKGSSKGLDLRCYVLGVEALSLDDIAFGSNSYRGDHFFADICQAIEGWEKDDYMFSPGSQEEPSPTTPEQESPSPDAAEKPGLSFD